MDSLRTPIVNAVNAVNVEKEKEEDGRFEKFPFTLTCNSECFESNVVLPQYRHWVWTMFGVQVKEMCRLFSAKEHGFKASVFHERCDGIANTIVFAKSREGKVFGGFAGNKWDMSSGFVSDAAKKSFLFSVDEKMKFFIQQNPEYAQKCNKDIGPTFGGNYDLSIADEANLNMNSCCCLGQCYEVPANGDVSILSGQKNFSVLDYEVFQVIFK